jgi:hypothetical protein
MLRNVQLRNLISICGGVAICAVTGNVLAASAAGPEAGSGWVALGYDYVHMQNHLDPDGHAFDIGSMNTQRVAAQVEYGLTDRLAIWGVLPYIQSQYTGSYPHTMTTPDGVVNVSQTDDGSYHGSFQDVSIGTKYGTSYGRWAIAPVIEYSQPTHAYPDFTHAAIGTNESRGSVGVFTGRVIPEPFDRFYFEFDYLYTVLEKFQGTTATRSTIFVETDFFATDRLMLRLFATGFKTHNGLGPSDFRNDAGEFEHHEQLGRTDSIDVGTGAAYRLTGRASVFASILHTTWGENIHEVKYDVRVGISRDF